MLHKCAMEGCEEQIPLGHLMCPDHWRDVPASVRADVNRTWRKRPAGGMENLKAYRKAVKKALEAVKKRGQERREGRAA